MLNARSTTIRSQADRRTWLRKTIGGSAVLGVAATAPPVLTRAAASLASSRDQQILVIIQLSGGNDGLNTVVPYTDDRYYENRPELAIAKPDVLKLNDSLGLHPSLRGMKELHELGQLSIIQGVGYDSPNRSHFESMDIWHTCLRKNERRDSGWLGRFIDQIENQAGKVEGRAGDSSSSSSDFLAMHLGNKQQPMALAARSSRVPTVASLDEFQLSNSSEALRAALDELSSATGEAVQGTASDDLLGFLRQSTSSALMASDQVKQVAETATSSGEYPNSELGERLSVVADLIDADMPCRVYYLELDGFDTHARQAEAHASLLQQWSDAVTAFMQDLTARELQNRVCVMSFSEFGRRVAENASGGTDHGAASCMFLAGGRLNPGLHGELPDLEDLHDGDLRYRIDFRRVYASVLQQWLQSDPKDILHGEFETLPLFG